MFVYNLGETTDRSMNGSCETYIPPAMGLYLCVSVSVRYVILSNLTTVYKKEYHKEK